MVFNKVYYSIFAYDIQDSLPLRAKARSEHIARLKQLDAEGRLIIAGPNPAIDSNEPGDAGFSGSLIVAEFKSLEAAKASISWFITVNSRVRSSYNQPSFRI